MRNLKLINKNLNQMHDALEGLRDSIENIEGVATRKAAKSTYNDLVQLMETLDGLLS